MAYVFDPQGLWLEESPPKKKKGKTPLKITKKYYVGSRAMLSERSDWAHEKVEDAVEHAKDLAAETDEPQIVVQIIKLVKPERAPVTVEDV